MFKDIRFLEQSEGVLQNYQLSYNAERVYPVALIDEPIDKVEFSNDDEGDNYMYAVNGTRLVSLDGYVALGPYQVHIFRGTNFDFMGICNRYEPKLTFLHDEYEVKKALELLKFVRV